MQENQENTLRQWAWRVFYATWIVWGSSMLLDWEMGKNAIYLWLILCGVLYGRKINDLSDITLPENTHITPENATQILQQSRRWAVLQGVMCAVLFYVLIVSHNAQYAWGTLFFVLPAGGIVAWAFYANAKKHIRQILNQNAAG